MGIDYTQARTRVCGRSRKCGHATTARKLPVHGYCSALRDLGLKIVFVLVVVIIVTLVICGLHVCHKLIYAAKNQLVAKQLFALNWPGF